MEDGTIFEPGDKELKKEYKELGEIYEFRDLSDLEVKLCWYVGCKSSPYQILDYADRINKALILLEFSDEDSAKYLKGKMPEKVKAGIDKMKSFNPGARTAGRFALEEAFRNITAVMTISKTELMSMDMGARKQYVELAAKATGEIPALIEKMESGFGVKTKSGTDKQTGKGSGLADSVVQEIHKE